MQYHKKYLGSFTRFFASLLIVLALANCGTQTMSVYKGRFDVTSQPLFLNAFSRDDTISSAYIGGGGFYGANTQFRSSGLKNKGYKEETIILPESDADIRYNMLSFSGDLSGSFTSRISPIEGWPGYIGLRFGALPYPYGEMHGGFRHKYGFLGFSGSWGYTKSRAVYTSESATESFCLAEGCGVSWDHYETTIDKKSVGHSVVTYGGEISADVGPVILDYYLGIYKPWVTDQLPAYRDSSYTETSDYDISFEFPFLFVQDIAVSYRFNNFRILSGARIVASEDLNYFQVGLFGQIAVRL